jgi:hypothetical protein
MGLLLIYITRQLKPTTMALEIENTNDLYK